MEQITGRNGTGNGFAAISGNTGQGTLKKRMIRHKEFYFMLLVPVVWYITFLYLPMYGIQIAFKDFNPVKGIAGSPWAGMKYFEEFFSSYYFARLLKNTITLSLANIVFGFPVPILLALLVNEIQNNTYKKLLQNVTYVPHFLSMVVVTGMIATFLAPETGIVNIFITHVGGQAVPFLQKPEWFKAIFVSSSIWQEAGYASIIYIAALSGIDPTQYEAATMDGASRFQKIRHISIPGIMPTIIILLILRIGQVMHVGFEKALLLQNDLNAPASDIIQTYIYRVGIQQGRYSLTTTVGLFNSVINFAFLMIANRLSNWKTDTGLF